MGRIVVFGATGYTGGLVCEALVRRGAAPVLAGRSAERLGKLAADLGGLETRVADVADAASVHSLVERGDVLVATVGPFVQWGRPAAEAAVLSGAHYLDSTGEPPFIREVFERFGPRAEQTGAAMLTAFGYDWVPGNLAGAPALREGGEAAVRVDTGYFLTGRASGGTGGPISRFFSSRGGVSGGTMKSMLGAIGETGFAWRGGRLVSELPAARVRRFALDGGRGLDAISVSASEHLALPRAYPRLREVNAYLGWFRPFSRAVQAFSALSVPLRRAGIAPRLLGAAASRVQGSSGGPDEQQRAQTGSLIVGEAYDAGGRRLSQIVLRGINGYSFTGEILAWGAMRAAEGGLGGAGALGPVDGFGLDALSQGCASAGIEPSSR